MALTREGSQELYDGSPSSPQTTAVNIGTRTNGLLTVTLYTHASNVISAFAMTYNGDSMTLDDNYEDPAVSNRHIYCFSLENPSDGNNNLVITFTVDFGGQLNHMYWIADWWDGAAQSSPFDSRTQGNGSTDPSVAHTPGENNCAVIAHYFSMANDVLSVGSGETLRDDYDLGNRVSGGSFVIQTTAAEQTVDFTGDDDTWFMTVASYKAAAVGVTVTPASINAIAGKADPTVVLGSVTITPTAGNTIASKADPTVLYGSVTISPIAGYAITSSIDPTVLEGGNVLVTPAAINAISSKVDPTVVLGSISITPTADYAIASKADPTVVLGSTTVTPTPDYAIASSVDPSVIEGDVLLITPAAIYIIASSSDPTTLVLNEIVVAMTLAARSWSFTLYDRRGFFVIQYMLFEDESGADFEDGDNIAWGAARSGISLSSRSLNLTISDHD